MAQFLYNSEQQRSRRNDLSIEFRVFYRSHLMREDAMIAMIGLLLFALCVFFIMCILIVGKRADHKKDLMFMDRIEGLQEVKAFCYSPSNPMTKLGRWSSLHPQKNAL
jgi:hypothetical protein